MALILRRFLVTHRFIIKKLLYFPLLRHGCSCYQLLFQFVEGRDRWRRYKMVLNSTYCHKVKKIPTTIYVKFLIVKWYLWRHNELPSAPSEAQDLPLWKVHQHPLQTSHYHLAYPSSQGNIGKKKNIRKKRQVSHNLEFKRRNTGERRIKNTKKQSRKNDEVIYS